MLSVGATLYINNCNKIITPKYFLSYTETRQIKIPIPSSIHTSSTTVTYYYKSTVIQTIQRRGSLERDI